MWLATVQIIIWITCQRQIGIISIKKQPLLHNFLLEESPLLNIGFAILSTQTQALYTGTQGAPANCVQAYQSQTHSFSLYDNFKRGWSALMWASQTYPGVAGTKKDFITNDAMKNRRIVAEHLLKAADESNVDLVNLEANVSIIFYAS